MAWLLVLAMMPACACALPAGTTRNLNVLVRRAFLADDTLGAAVAIAQDGEIVYTYAYGTAVLEGKVPVEDGTLFRTASVTKLATAVGALSLCEQGLLDLDADIGRYLGYPVRNPRFPETPVTLRQLLSHTAGLKHHKDYAKREGPERMALREMLSDGPNVADNFAKFQPGEDYEYSNFGAGVVGSVMEAATGQRLQEIMQACVFDPLGIAAYYHPADVPGDVPMAATYHAENKRKIWDPYRVALEPTESGADPEQHYDVAVGSLLISAQDLAKLLSVVCGDGSVQGVRILYPETAALMRTPQGGLGSVTGSHGGGLGVSIRTGLVKKKTLYGHQGVLHDFICDAYCEPESGVAVVVLTNATQALREDGVYILARSVMQAAFETMDRVRNSDAGGR